MPLPFVPFQARQAWQYYLSERVICAYQLYNLLGFQRLFGTNAMPALQLGHLRCAEQPAHQWAD